MQAGRLSHSMMRLAVARLALLAALSAASLAQAAEWKPFNFATRQYLDKAVEGPDRMLTYITIGDARMVVRLPQLAKTSSSPAGLTLFLTEAGARGELRVTNSSMSPELDLVTNVDDFKKAADAGIPAEAEEIEHQDPSGEVYSMNEWKSMTFSSTYKHFVQRMYRQVAYINIEGGQVCLTLTCVADDAERAQGIARRFMASWYIPMPTE